MNAGRTRNLLKIEVTHGFDLKVPVVGRILTSALALVDDDDPGRQAYYLAGLLPLTSTATVRMQSEVWGDDIVPAAGSAPGGRPAVDNLIDPVATADAPEPFPGVEAPENGNLPASGAGGLDDLLGGDDLPNSPLPLVAQECGA